jgi:hypothetical protein
MPDLRIGLLKAIVDAFARVIQDRGKQRQSVFEAIVLIRFDTLRHIHRDFHSSLLPLDRALSGIETEIHVGGGKVRSKLKQLAKLLSEVDAARYLSQPERRELFDSCQFLARSSFQFSGLPQPLNEEERGLVTLFMNDVCAYFLSNDRYQHEYGNTISALAGLVDMWMTRNTPTTADIADTRGRLDAIVGRMAERWTKVVEDFSRIEASLKANVRIDPPNRGQQLRYQAKALREARDIPLLGLDKLLVSAA